MQAFYLQLGFRGQLFARNSANDEFAIGLPNPDRVVCVFAVPIHLRSVLSLFPPRRHCHSVSSLAVAYCGGESSQTVFRCYFYLWLPNRPPSVSLPVGNVVSVACLVRDA